LPEVRVRTFHLLLANTLVANVTNNFLWFALTFWVYLETRSVLGTAVIGGGYMLLVALSGMVFGTFVDRHRRWTTMLLSSSLSLGLFALAGAVYVIAPPGAVSDLGHPAFWAFVLLILGGAIAGNLRSIALSTSVTLLVPEDRHDRRTGSSAPRTAWRSRSPRCSVASPSGCWGWAGAWRSRRA
jgi:DHA3 family multidrug efflux protein-like MFS transporter